MRGIKLVNTKGKHWTSSAKKAMVPAFQEVIKQTNTFARQVRFDSELGSSLRFFPDFFSMQDFLHPFLGHFPPPSPPCPAAVSAVNSICLPCGDLLVELLGTNLKPLTPRLQIVPWIPQHKGCHFLPQKQRKNLVSSRAPRDLFAISLQMCVAL